MQQSYTLIRGNLPGPREIQMTQTESMLLCRPEKSPGNSFYALTKGVHNMLCNMRLL